ncbi:MAG: ABC transporter ATP-binding protein, partial [Anaerolineae bacterium]|nr:ABC transporter ATP-binding protein [Anaerolineae bacterium]
MGFFSNLDTEPYDRQYKDSDLVRRILTYFRPHARRMVLIGFYLILIAAAGAIAPIMVSRGVDLLQSEFSSRQVGLISSLVLLAGLTTWSANWIRRRLTVRAIGDVVLQIRLDGFQSAAAHDLSFYDEFSSG